MKARAAASATHHDPERTGSLGGPGRPRPAVFVLLIAGLACNTVPAEVSDISASALQERSVQEVLILDVRSAEEYAEGHVPGAVNIPHDELADRIAEVDADKGDPVVVYCERGMRAGWAASTLLDAGYSEILHLEGDMTGWRDDGRPVETP